MTYAHYGHDTGHTPVCYGRGPEGVVLPHGQGITAAMRWCPECRQALKEAGGCDLKDVQLDMFEELLVGSLDISGVPSRTAPNTEVLDKLG